LIRSMFSGRCSAAAAVVLGHLFLCGGSGEGARRLRITERFDPLTGEWTMCQAMTERRSNASCVVVAGKLYVCGGLGENSQRLRTVERFDPHRNVWESVKAMTERRSTAAAAVLSGQLFICGGRGDNSQPLDSVERFDPKSGSWHGVMPMMEKRWEVPAAVVAGKLYVCGGSGGGSTNLSTAEKFDPLLGTWERLPPMLERRSGASRWARLEIISTRCSVDTTLCGLHRHRRSVWSTEATLGVHCGCSWVKNCQRSSYVHGVIGLPAQFVVEVHVCDTAIPGHTPLVQYKYTRVQRATSGGNVMRTGHVPGSVGAAPPSGGNFVRRSSAQ